MSTHVVLWFQEPQLARLISCRLMRADFEVHTVHDDQAACEAIQRLRPELLVTDYRPERAEVLRQAQVHSTGVIGLTNSCRPSGEIIELCRQGLLSAVLALPCSLRRLVDLARHLTQHEPSCQLAVK